MSLALNNWAQSFNDTLTNDIVSFEQLGSGPKICKAKSICLFDEMCNTVTIAQNNH